MRRETVEQLLVDREIKQEDGSFTIPEDQVANLLIGQGQASVIGGLVRLTLKADYLLVETKKGTQSYVEYDFVRAISFEPSEIADRHAGFF